jgi:hypothetical protein
MRENFVFKSISYEIYEILDKKLFFTKIITLKGLNLVTINKAFFNVNILLF